MAFYGLLKLGLEVEHAEGLQGLNGFRAGAEVYGHICAS